MGYVENDIGGVGGNLLCLVKLDSSNAIPGSLIVYPTTSWNCHNFGHVEEEEPTLESSMDMKKSCDNVVRKVINKDRVAKTVAKIMQASKDNMDFLANCVAGQNYLEILFHQVVGGYYQWVFKIVRVVSQVKGNKMPEGGSLDYESVAICPAAAVTFSSGNLTAIETALGIAIHPTSVTIAANAEQAITNTAVS